MTKKVEILGIQLDNYTVREAIMCVERYLTNGVLNTIETVSLQMLMDSEKNPALREALGSLDLTVIGDREILEAAGIGTMQRIRETEENDFYFEFFKRIERNQKSVFLLGETAEKTGEFQAELEREFPRLIFAGSYAVDQCGGDVDAVINDMNAAMPDVVASALPSPLQEEFLGSHKAKMDAGIWYGVGKIPAQGERRGVLARLKSRIHRGKLVSSMNQYVEKERE